MAEPLDIKNLPKIKKFGKSYTPAIFLKNLHCPDAITLLTSVHEWNHRRLTDPYYRPDLRNAYLSKANLENANLSSMDLSNANLSRANLKGAEFSRSILSEANLIGADLRKANFYGADLTYAKFYGANTRETNFTHANMWFCSGLT